MMLLNGITLFYYLYVTYENFFGLRELHFFYGITLHYFNEITKYYASGIKHVNDILLPLCNGIPLL